MEKTKKKGVAIEGMGMYLVAVILAVISIIMILYLGGNLVTKIINQFKDILNMFFGFL